VIWKFELSLQISADGFNLMLSLRAPLQDSDGPEFLVNGEYEIICGDVLSRRSDVINRLKRQYKVVLLSVQNIEVPTVKALFIHGVHPDYCVGANTPEAMRCYS
jgi:hypothetical protein